MTFYGGQPLTATDLNMTASSNADSTSRTTTSTGFTSTLSPANICGVAFTAPPSGKVELKWSSACSNSSSPNTAICAPAVRTGSVVGSGSTFMAADDARSIWYSTTNGPRFGASTSVTGLTAGVVYNVALEHRSNSAGTSTFQAREVIVTPQLA